MGQMKEYMIEIMSQLDVEIEFLCPVCGQPVSVSFKMDPDNDQHHEDVTCLNDEDEHEWTVVVLHQEGRYTAAIVEDPEINVSLEVDDHADFWEEPDPEPNSYKIFQTAMREWDRNVDQLSVPAGDSSRNRMLFITLYAIAESYFSDAVNGNVVLEQAVQKQLLKTKGLGLADIKISLETILDKPDIVRDRIGIALKSLSYHNLLVVDAVSKLAFGIMILPKDPRERGVAVGSVRKRHDCVHRNGFDSDGTRHVDITPQYLRDLGSIFEGMASTLEDAIKDTRARRHFDAGY